MESYNIILILLLFELACFSGHVIKKDDRSMEIYKVKENGTLLEFIDPKPEKPALREIIFYHMIERPYQNNDQESSAKSGEEGGPPIDDVARGFTNGQGMQFSHSGNNKPETTISTTTAANSEENPSDTTTTSNNNEDTTAKPDSDEAPSDEIPLIQHLRRRRDISSNIPQGPSLPDFNLDLPDYIKAILPSTQTNTQSNSDDDMEANTEANNDSDIGDNIENQVDNLEQMLRNAADDQTTRQANKADQQAVPRTYGMDLHGDNGVVWNDLTNPHYTYYLTPNLVGSEDHTIQIPHTATTVAPTEGNQPPDSTTEQIIQYNIPTVTSETPTTQENPDLSNEIESSASALDHILIKLDKSTTTEATTTTQIQEVTTNADFSNEIKSSASALDHILEELDQSTTTKPATTTHAQEVTTDADLSNEIQSSFSTIGHLLEELSKVSEQSSEGSDDTSKKPNFGRSILSPKSDVKPKVHKINSKIIEKNSNTNKKDSNAIIINPKIDKNAVDTDKNKIKTDLNHISDHKNHKSSLNKPFDKNNNAAEDSNNSNQNVFTQDMILDFLHVLQDLVKIETAKSAQPKLKTLNETADEPNKNVDKHSNITSEKDKITTEKPLSKINSTDKAADNSTKDQNNVIEELMQNKQFWSWLSNSSEAYLNVLMNRIDGLIKMEVSKQIEELLQKQKSNTTNQEKMDNTNTTKLTAANENVPKNATKLNATDDEVNPIDNSSNEKPKNDELARKIKSKDENKVDVKATHVFGNSVGNERVTNIFIFNLNNQTGLDNLNPMAKGNLFVFGNQTGNFKPKLEENKEHNHTSNPEHTVGQNNQNETKEPSPSNGKEDKSSSKSKPENNNLNGHNSVNLKGNTSVNLNENKQQIPITSKPLHDDLHNSTKNATSAANSTTNVNSNEIVNKSKNSVAPIEKDVVNKTNANTNAKANFTTNVSTANKTDSKSNKNDTAISEKANVKDNSTQTPKMKVATHTNESTTEKPAVTTLKVNTSTEATTVSNATDATTISIEAEATTISSKADATTVSNVTNATTVSNETDATIVSSKTDATTASTTKAS